MGVLCPRGAPNECHCSNRTVVEGRSGVRYVGRPDGVRQSAATNMGCLLSLSLFIFISFERP